MGPEMKANKTRMYVNAMMVPSYWIGENSSGCMITRVGSFRT